MEEEEDVEDGDEDGGGTPRDVIQREEEASDSQTVISKYVADPVGEVFGSSGDQTEEFSDENKSIVWFLVKQVRPGMDLSRVVLPTFILEPRSFLDKLTDYHYHADILAE